MNMFGLEGSGFLIAISVSLLLVGAVVYYFNTRVASLEKALVRQNQVLADFIQNVKASRMEARATHLMEQPGNGATNEAVQAAQQYYSNTVPQEKVDVSDDDEDEASEDGEDDLSDSDDSELDSDDEDDSEENKESMDYPDLSKVKEVNPIVIGNGDEQAFFSMIVDMTTQVPVEKVVEKEGPQVIELLDDNELEEQTDNLTPVEVKAEEDNDEKKVIKLSDVQDLDQVSSSLGSSLEDEDEDDGETIDSKQENVMLTSAS